MFFFGPNNAHHSGTQDYSPIPQKPNRYIHLGTKGYAIFHFIGGQDGHEHEAHLIFDLKKPVFFKQKEFVFYIDDLDESPYRYLRKKGQNFEIESAHGRGGGRGGN